MRVNFLSRMGFLCHTQARELVCCVQECHTGNDRSADGNPVCARGWYRQFSVNDTHLHKPLKGYTQQIAAKWHTRNVMSLNDKRYPGNASTDPITEADYNARMSALMSIGRLRNMAAYWLDEAVKYISKPIEERVAI